LIREGKRGSVIMKERVASGGGRSKSTQEKGRWCSAIYEGEGRLNPEQRSRTTSIAPRERAKKALCPGHEGKERSGLQKYPVRRGSC